MKTELYEKAVMVKLFHNEGLRKLYLPGLVLGLFYDRERRLIIYMMQQLHAYKAPVTVENMVITQNKVLIKTFAKKHRIPLPINEDIISNHLYDTSVDGTPAMFQDAFEHLHDEAFAYYVEGQIGSLNYDLAYKDRNGILSTTKAIQKVHNILYRSKLTDRSDQIGNTFSDINRGGAYLRISSQKLTSMLGGWSRGYAGSAIGRPSHNKSTWFTFDSTWQVNHNGLDQVHVIGCEETPVSFWRRVFGIELSVPIRSLIEGTIQLSDEDLRRVKDKYQDKIIFHSVRDLGDISDLLFSLKIEYAWIDHVNAVVYPRGDMLNGIITLVEREKQWLDINKDSVIVNLSQVNTKQILRNGRLFPRKEDAYNSSVLEQASREFLSFYYPYKDSIDDNMKSNFAGRGKMCQQNMIQVSVEKNSYGDVGITELGYEYQFGRFRDEGDWAKVTDTLLSDQPALDFGGKT